MTLTRRSFATAIALTPLAPAALRARSASAQAAPIPTLATFSIIGDVVRNVGGELIALDVLVGPDSDAHTFEPSPSDITKVSDATLIFENGVGFEPWLDDIYGSSDSSATRVAVAEGLTLLGLEEHGHEGEEQAEGDEAHDEDNHDEEEHAEGEEEREHDERDPHVWHDVKSVIAEVAVIRDALAAADSANAATYAANAVAYLAQLTDLEAFVTAEVEKLPQERRKLITSHDALGYLAAYGFEIVGTALGSLSTETADPSGGEIAGLVEEIMATGVPAIFAENIEGTDLMRQIADDAGVALAPPVFTDALGQPDSPGATYIDMVRYNMTTIVTALGGV
jgi:ABC-type Zn uptake system ZnuABC Zn-binding protein ZnuA